MDMKKIYFAAALACLTLASCGEKDLFNAEQEQARQTAAFEANFVAKYGQPSANKNWDMSIAGSRYAATRAEGDIKPVISSEWYYVQQNTLDYMLDELKEGENNRAKGTPFIMSAPNNGFAIYPIYQGGAAFKWDLHMVVEQSGKQIADVLVWEKHRDIECQLSEEQIEQDLNPVNRDGNPCTPFAKQFGYSRNTTDWYDTKHCFSLEPGGWWQDYEFGWNTMAAAAIRTKGIHFPTLPIGANIYFYLDVKNEVDGNWVDKKKESSLAHMMVALNCQTPTNLPNREITIIGCEDESEECSDWDMNDLVFMVVGDPIVPKPIEIKEDKYEEITVAKRYMIEDLGTTDDFDFNDIVVDVEEYCVHEIKVGFGVKLDDKAGDKHQRAIIRHLGGTLPWNLKIGDYETGMQEGKMEVNPDKYIELPDGTWKPEENNISVYVPRSGNSELVFTIKFPKQGTIPTIIAVDPTQPWMKERVNIPAEWTK